MYRDDGNDGLIHYALSYDTRAGYLEAVVPFLRQASAAGEPVVAMVPPGNLELLRGAVDSATRADVTLLDMDTVGRNPARIIPTAREFAAAHPQRRIRVVGEPIWPGQPAKRIREGIRHEACVNTLFADIDATVLCPYDARLGATVLTAAGQTHSHRSERGTHAPNPGYVDPTVTLDRWDQLSPAPTHPAVADSVHEVSELAALRTVVRAWATHAGLEQDRVSDLVLALDAAVSTVVTHGSSAAVRGWSEQHSMVCEVTDTIRGPDLFAGRLPPPPGASHDGSLWTINHVCDLVEHRSYPHGTVVRMHLEQPGPTTRQHRPA